LKAGTAGYMVCFCFLFISINFNDSRQTNYLEIYRIDRRQVFSGSRTMAVEDQSEISFSILRGGVLPWQPIFLLVLSTELIRWTQAASGAAGWDNVASR